MILNKEWYIILRELETEEIIHKNHIMHGSYLKVNPTLKEIKKSGYNWNNIEKDIREFYFKCPTCGIRLPNLEKKLCSKVYRVGLFKAKIPSWYSVFVWLHFKWYKIFI